MYQKASISFHQWTLDDETYGLNFATEDDAKVFAKVILQIVDILKKRRKMSKSKKSMSEDPSKKSISEDPSRKKSHRSTASVSEPQENQITQEIENNTIDSTPETDPATGPDAGDNSQTNVAASLNITIPEERSMPEVPSSPKPFEVDKSDLNNSPRPRGPPPAPPKKKMPPMAPSPKEPKRTLPKVADPRLLPSGPKRPSLARPLDPELITELNIKSSELETFKKEVFAYIDAWKEEILAEISELKRQRS